MIGPIIAIGAYALATVLLYAIGIAVLRFGAESALTMEKSEYERLADGRT